MAADDNRESLSGQLVPFYMFFFKKIIPIAVLTANTDTLIFQSIGNNKNN